MFSRVEKTLALTKSNRVYDSIGKEYGLVSTFPGRQEAANGK